MKLTVEDCMKMPAFAGARVISAKDRTDISVREACMLEANNGEQVEKFFNGKNTMFITAFMGIKTDVEAQCDVIRALAKNKDSVLVLFHVGEVMPSISPRIVKAANEVDLPIIQMGRNSEIGMVDAVDDIRRAIFYGPKEQFDNTLITNTIFHLLNFEKYIDFETAIRAAALHNDFQMILLSRDFNQVLTIETRYTTTIERAIRLGKKKDIEPGSVYTMIDVDGVLTYWGPVRINTDIYYMFIVDNEDSYSAAEITKLAEIIELSMGMWKYSPISDSNMEFIKALRRSNIEFAYTINDEAMIDEDSIESIFLVDIENADEQSKGEIDKALDDADFSVLRVEDEREIYGIIKDCREKDACSKLYDSMKGIAGIKLFHFTRINGIEEACEAFRTINETRSFAPRVFPYKRVFSKYEMALLSNCISVKLQGGSLRKNFAKLLSPLEDDRSEKSHQLLMTLEVFVLDAGMNATKASEIMGVHVNTIQYRLKRIGEILYGEIMGNRVVPGMTVALALKRLED